MHRRQGRVRHDDPVRQERRTKLVPECSYPITGRRCVSRVYTEQAIVHRTADRVLVTETFGTTLADLRARLDVALRRTEPHQQHHDELIE